MFNVHVTLHEPDLKVLSGNRRWFLPSFDIDACHHSRHDRKMMSRFVHQIVLMGANEHPIIDDFGFYFVLNSVRRDGFNIALNSAVNGVIVGRNFCQRALSGMKKDDISRKKTRFNHQMIVYGNNFHHFTCPDAQGFLYAEFPPAPRCAIYT